MTTITLFSVRNIQDLADIVLQDPTIGVYFYPSLQGLQQASIEAVTGFSDTWNDDWEHLWDLDGIPDNNFDGRMLDWINKELHTAYTNLPGAQVAFANSLGQSMWTSVGTFDAAPNKLILRQGASNPLDIILR